MTKLRRFPTVIVMPVLPPQLIFVIGKGSVQAEAEGL